MRETFRVRACERVDPGSLTTAEILRRKMAWNAEELFWIHDPIHTLALADEFGFVGKKQLEQTKWKVTVAPGSKTVDPTRAVKCMLKRLRKHYSEASVHSWETPFSRNAVRGQSGERGMLGR